LGHTSKWEVQIARNPFDNAPTAPEFGGVFPPKKPKTAVKFSGEARGCFGCAMRTGVTGEREGVKAAPFNYTGLKVVGVRTWEKEVQAELARVIPLKGCGGKPGQGYKDLYPIAWKAVVLGNLTTKQGGVISITEIMDHVVVESKKIYKGTAVEDTFLIFHDGLAQWWESDAQDHLAHLGFKDRQLRCYGATNQAFARYRNKVVGDSPELCRGLDAHGFSDLKRSMAFHTSLSSYYPVDDPRRFKMGTPSQVFHTMERCWEMEPTSERIVEDISDLPRVLNKIIESEGRVVSNECMRNGRHAREGEGSTAANKPRNRQKKDTIRAPPCHPDCRDALDRIAGLNVPVEAVVEAAEQLLMVEVELGAAEDAEDEVGEGDEGEEEVG
jgi:hypothetical protein